MRKRALSWEETLIQTSHDARRWTAIVISLKYYRLNYKIPRSWAASTRSCPVGNCRKFAPKITRKDTVSSPIISRKFLCASVAKIIKHRQRARGLSGMPGRNQNAVRKVASGLLKLIYPHRIHETLTEDEIVPCVDLARESRERVLAQLAVMAPGEFGLRLLRLH